MSVRVPGGYNPANVAITGGSISPGVIGMSGDLAVSGVSVGIAPTGSMGNNGAVTLGTALDRIYTEGLWLFYPAGAVAAGVPASASFLWTVMSSTTVGTVFNSTYTTGVPTVGTTTAFVTTGPGAFTGATSEQGVTLPLAAGVMGAMGSAEFEASWRNNNSVGAKTARLRWSGSAGTVIFSNAPTTLTQLDIRASVFNSTTGAQTYKIFFVNSNNTVLSTNGNTAIDTTAATSGFLSMQTATATDWMIMSFCRAKLDRSA